MARLNNIMILLRDVPRSVQFFREGLGLTVNVASETFAEVNAGPITIALKASDSVSTCTTGYSPMLQFDVDDMDMTVVRALSLGGTLDGPIKYPAHGKVASIRAPGGQMIGLFEPNMDLRLMQEAAQGLRPPQPPPQSQPSPGDGTPGGAGRQQPPRGPAGGVD